MENRIISVDAKTYEALVKDYGEMPCKACGMPLEEKSVCRGCKAKSAWSGPFEEMPQELRGLAEMHNMALCLDRRIAILKSEIADLEEKRDALLEMFGSKVRKIPGAEKEESDG